MAQHEVAYMAFKKCVVPSTKGGKLDDYHLTEEEKSCVNEYAGLHVAFLQNGYIQFQSLFEQQQMRAMEAAKQEYMERVAREDLRGKA